MAEKVTTGTTGHSDAGHAKVFSPLDSATFVPQLVWLALTFGLLYVLLKRFALPRVGEVIEERRERIQRDFEKAEKLKAETEQALASYEQALAEARTKANAIAKDVRDKLAAEVDKERAAVDAQIASKVADAEARISPEQGQGDGQRQRHRRRYGQRRGRQAAGQGSLQGRSTAGARAARRRVEDTWRC